MNTYYEMLKLFLNSILNDTSNFYYMCKDEAHVQECLNTFFDIVTEYNWQDYILGRKDKHIDLEAGGTLDFYCIKDVSVDSIRGYRSKLNLYFDDFTPPVDFKEVTKSFKNPIDKE